MPNFHLWIGADEEKTNDILQTCIQNAAPPSEDDQLEASKELITLFYPLEGEVRYQLSLYINNEKELLELRTANPVIKSTTGNQKAYPVYVTDISHNKKTGEALIYADYGAKSGPCLNFFDPYFHLHPCAYKKGNTTMIHLTGLVMQSTTEFEKEFQISEGPLFENARKEELANNEKNIEPVTVSLENLRSLISFSEVGLEDAAQFYTLIENTTIIPNPFGDNIISWNACCMQYIENNENNEELIIPFYLNPDFHTGDSPTEKTLIRGDVWLQGSPIS